VIGSLLNPVKSICAFKLLFDEFIDMLHKGKCRNIRRTRLLARGRKMEINQIFSDIYGDVFCNTYSKSCYVFLCGGTDKEHIRNSVRLEIEKDQFQILYPEDLFIEMLNRDKKADLLEYENLLADNSDIVCIICESYGSAVELGAFIQNSNIKNKLIVAVKSEYARNKSFIMLGPIKHLKKIDSDRVIFYKDSNLGELCASLKKEFRKLHRKGNISHKMFSFEKLSAFIMLIPTIVYFFQSITRKEIHSGIRDLLKSNEQFPEKYNELFNISIKYLLKNGILITDYDIETNNELFLLSEKGYCETLKLLNNSVAKERTVLHDRIKCVILKEQTK
jgi:hypothetical protein